MDTAPHATSVAVSERKTTAQHAANVNASEQTSGDTGTRSAADAPTAITSADRRAMVACAAYYRAEARDFAPGCEVDDWLLAEKDVDTTLTP